MAVKAEKFLLSANVYHKRFATRQNEFNYRSYFIAIDMKYKISNLKLFSINKANIFSFKDKDHGYKNGDDSRKWAEELLSEQCIKFDVLKIITMPRVLGYLFNPVSFWLAYSKERLVAVIAEVNNTFGETHSYICHKNNAEITGDDWFKADKNFHVSPFFERNGYYKFNFKINMLIEKRNHIFINHYDNNDNIRLATSIDAITKKMSSLELLRQSVRCPLLTFKVFGLIHYQAIKLFLKKIKYISKPEQKPIRVTLAKSITNI